MKLYDMQKSENVVLIKFKDVIIISTLYKEWEQFCCFIELNFNRDMKITRVCNMNRPNEWIFIISEDIKQILNELEYTSVTFDNDKNNIRFDYCRVIEIDRNYLYGG